MHDEDNGGGFPGESPVEVPDGALTGRALRLITSCTAPRGLTALPTRRAKPTRMST